MSYRLSAPILALVMSMSGAAAEDFSGMWLLSGPGTESEILLTETGKAIQDNYDLLVDDPSLYCTPASTSRVWANPNALIKIEQSSNELLISYELFDLRRQIPIGTDVAHSSEPSTKNLSGSFFPEMGSSTAYHRGEELVIESRNHAPGFIRTSRGIPQSSSTITHEVFSFEQSKLKITHTYTDPTLFLQPIVLEYFFERRSETEVALYECTDANYDWFNELNGAGQGVN